jgi:protein-disulfide isomerase
MKLTSETKLFIGIFALTGILITLAMIIMTKPPKPIAKEALILPTTYTKGNKDASVWLVEFSDFECPACKAFSSVIGDLIKKYPDKLLVAYRYFPLEMHPQAIPAAIAAESAGQQGKFWEMEQLLFINQEDLHGGLYENFALQLGLNMTLFKAAITDLKTKQIITNDIQYGNSIGIDATPTFFLNGVKLTLSAPSDLVKEVEKAIIGK